MILPPDQSLLEELFPPKVIPADQIGGIPLEVFSYQRDFGGRAWTEVDYKSYDRNHDAFSCMDHGTLRYYIAGFLKTIFNDPSSVSAEFIVYFAGDKGFTSFCEHLNPKQIDFLLATIDWIISDDYFGEDNRQQYAKQKTAILTQRGLKE
jgi:hypothetical protein